MRKHKVIRSSTPTHFFSTIHTDIDLQHVSDIEVRYMQDKRVIFTKSGSDVSIPTARSFSVKLTEEDTNSLDSSLKLYIRPVVIYPDGTRLPSANTICCTVEDL